MKCCRPPSFSSAIMGRSWADHGQIMGRPSAIDSCRKILKISAFSDAVFFRKIMKICDFRTRLERSVKLFLQTPYMFFGEKLLIFWIENQFYTLKSRFVKWLIHFTPRNAVFSKIRPYFLRTFWLSAIKRAHANMRSLIMAGNQHVLQSEHAFS